MHKYQRAGIRRQKRLGGGADGEGSSVARRLQRSRISKTRPYQVGTSHKVIQSNCTPPQAPSWNSHQAAGPWAYGYDFLMPVGTQILAARGGEVVYAEERYSDQD